MESINSFPVPKNLFLRVCVHCVSRFRSDKVYVISLLVDLLLVPFINLLHLHLRSPLPLCGSDRAATSKSSDKKDARVRNASRKHAKLWDVDLEESEDSKCCK